MNIIKQIFGRILVLAITVVFIAAIAGCENLAAPEGDNENGDGQEEESDDGDDGTDDGDDGTVAVEGVNLNVDEVTLGNGGTFELIASLDPENATDDGIVYEWASENDDVVSVPDSQSSSIEIDAGGQTGTANVSVTIDTPNGEKSATVSVTRTEGSHTAVTGVSITPSETSLVAGEESALTVDVEPSEATNDSVTWSSSNSDVATVDAGGNVTAVAAGSATITVTTDDGGYTDSVAVSVTPQISGVTIDPEVSVLQAGATGVELSAAVTPEEAVDEDVSYSWSTSDSGIIAITDSEEQTVSLEAVDTAGEEATISVTASLDGESWNDSIDITVTADPVFEVVFDPVEQKNIDLTTTDAAVLSRSAGDSMNVELDLGSHTVDTDTDDNKEITWAVDGEPVSAGQESIALYADEFSPEVYELTVVVRIDDAPYSSSLSFRVVEN